ncbi:MAG: hypothetical protein D6780_03245 [Candidatus Dadabacteria bacterium]|nr:MAG: hypothetical protein D6780_03245 [Candidatus Dadabacteria bacterium]
MAKPYKGKKQKGRASKNKAEEVEKLKAELKRKLLLLLSSPMTPEFFKDEFKDYVNDIEEGQWEILNKKKIM